MIDGLVEFQELILVKSTRMYARIYFCVGMSNPAQLVLSPWCSSLEGMWCRAAWPPGDHLTPVELREAHFPLKYWNCCLPPYVKSPQGPEEFLFMLTAVWFCISPCRNGWSGWQAGEKLLCDLNPPSALGALALLIPVLLMPAMEASLPGALVVPALCSWLWMICFGCFPTEKNLLWEYDKGQDLLLGHVHVHLFLQGKGDFLDITGGLGDLQSLCSSQLPFFLLLSLKCHWGSSALYAHVFSEWVLW